MSFNAKTLLKHGLLSLPLVVLLSGCGDELKRDTASASAAPAASENVVRVTGGAIKGVIQQGLVTAHRLVKNEHGVYETDRILSRSVRTDNSGKFDLQLRGKASGWALVELRADERTLMTCDVVPFCEIAGKPPVPFGQSFALTGDFTLRGAVDLAQGSVYLTPLSQLAVGLAERSASGLSEEALGEAYSQVEGWFGLSAGTLQLPPPDLTQLDSALNVSADAVQLAVINAAFLAVVSDDPKWESLTDVLADMMNQVATKGRLDTIGDGSGLALSDISATAAVQASELQATVESSIMSQKLAIVTQRNRKQFEAIANGYLDGTGTHGSDAELVADNGSPGVNPGSSSGQGANPSPNSGGSGIVDGGAPVGGNTDIGTGSGSDSSGDTLAANAARLSWQAPFTRENGDSISMGELAGYEIVYGLSPDSLDKMLAIADASTDQVVIDDLTRGNWYFAIRSIDTDGNKSRLSPVVSKTINI